MITITAYLVTHGLDGARVPDLCQEGTWYEKEAFEMAEKSNTKPVQKDLEAVTEDTKREPVPDTKDLVGDGRARVRTIVENKIGGPGYSSIIVGFSVELMCSQDDESIRKAADTAHATCLALVDDHIDNAYNALLAHVDRNYRGS